MDAYNKIIHKDIASSITTRVSESNQTFIVEVNGGGGLPIRNATKKGYLIAEEGDGVDISTRMATHRGTVQKGIAQTIKSEIDVGVVVRE